VSEEASSMRPRIRLEGHTVHLGGMWTAATLEKAYAEAQKKLPPEGTIIVDFAGVTKLDTSGAWFIDRALRALHEQGREVHSINLSPGSRSLLNLVGEQADPREVKLTRLHFTFLQRAGHASLKVGDNALDYLAFLGETAIQWLRVVTLRAHWRLPMFFTHLEQTGVNAVPIIGLLSFLIGVVIAYQGLYLLQNYGATALVARLAGLTILRELGPLIAAIVVAGRTSSAFTAEIGAMRVSEEIDAIVAMGLSPAEMLVLPRIFGLVVALPLLTVLADAAGIVGAGVTAHLVGGIAPRAFAHELAQGVGVTTLLTGLAKAPVFAVVIATLGCFHGFRAESNAESVGRRTTRSVVQSIFFVIVIDAVFSVAYSNLHL